MIGDRGGKEEEVKNGDGVKIFLGGKVVVCGRLGGKGSKEKGVWVCACEYGTVQSSSSSVSEEDIDGIEGLRGMAAIGPRGVGISKEAVFFA